MSPITQVLRAGRMTLIVGSEWIYYYDFRDYQTKGNYIGYTRANNGSGTRVVINMDNFHNCSIQEVLTGVALESNATNNRNTIVSAIQSIQNNTTRRIDVPFQLVRPESDSKAYRILLGLYDMQGNPEAPDSNPTIQITNIAGVVRLVETPMILFTGQIGQYYYDYVLSTEAPIESQIVTIKVIEGGITTYHKRSTEILDATTEFDIIKDQITLLTTMVSRVLGLTHENIYVSYTFEGDKHTGSTIEIYNSKANAEIHNGTTGLIAKYTLTASFDVNEKLSSHLMVKLP
jgi:hypothetical protein